MPDLFANLMASQAINRDYFSGKTGQMLTTLGPSLHSAGARQRNEREREGERETLGPEACLIKS